MRTQQIDTEQGKDSIKNCCSTVCSKGKLLVVLILGCPSILRTLYDAVLFLLRKLAERQGRVDASMLR
jgi:hypothetical protein